MTPKPFLTRVGRIYSSRTSGMREMAANENVVTNELRRRSP